MAVYIHTDFVQCKVGFIANALLPVSLPALVSQRFTGTFILQLNWLIVPSMVILPITGTVPSGLEAFRFK
jgi:hypothetical protein